jgi:hypothetical protein
LANTCPWPWRIWNPLLTCRQYFYRQTLKPASRPRPITLLNRLTSKLRITTPPNSPSLASPTYNPLSPTRPNNVPGSDYSSKEHRQTALREQGLRSPKDLSSQEREHDIYYATIVQDDTYEYHVDGKRTTESKRIQEQWKAKNPGLNKNAAARDVAHYPRSKGPIYPAVLATPQFGRSKSTPDFVKHIRRLEGAETANQFADILPTLAESPAHDSSTSSVGPPINDETHVTSSPKSSSLSPSAQKWLRPPPDRGLPPIPADAHPGSGSPVLPIEISPRFANSSQRNSFVTTNPSPPKSQVFALDSLPSPTSPDRRGGGRNSSERRVSQGICTTDEIASAPVRGPSFDRLPPIVGVHAYGEEPDRVMATVVEEGDRDVTDPSFSIVRAQRRERRESKDALTIQSPRRPRTADPPRPKTSDSISNSSPRRSERRKSFVAQSLHNLRKSVTDTIIKARPKSPATTSSTVSLPISSNYDVSQLPPSPTILFPVRPSTASDSHSSGARVSLGLRTHG